MEIKRPMLSATIDDLSLFKFPKLASPKLDGFRCLKVNGKALSRSFKPIANVYTRETVETFPDGLDGELMLANPNATFNEISSAFRKYEGEPDFVFFVFDFVMEAPFKERLAHLETVINNPRIKFVPHILVGSWEEVREFEEKCLAEGYEGVMLRDPEGPYKQGRATEKEGYLLKVKRFEDSEAEILDFKEQMHNTNEQEVNELGLSSRSSKKENMVPANTLGKFVVRDLYTGVEFDIGSGEGLTDELRKEIWDNQDKYKTEIIKYKYQKIGTKDKPRIPIWLGFRDREDI